MASSLFGSKRPRKPHLVAGGDLGAEIADLRSDIEEAYAADEALGKIVVDEFTNPETASTNRYLTSTATSASASTPTPTNTTVGTSMIPRSVTVTRSSSTGAYTTSVITIVGKRRGVTVTLTFTPGTADGGDTIQSNEDDGLDTITSIAIPAQVSTAGAFTIGFGAVLITRYPIKSRAGVVNWLKEINANAAVALTGTFSGRKYTPLSTAPNGTRDYSVTYEGDLTSL